MPRADISLRRNREALSSTTPGLVAASAVALAGSDEPRPYNVSQIRVTNVSVDVAASAGGTAGAGSVNVETEASRRNFIIEFSVTRDTMETDADGRPAMMGAGLFADFEATNVSAEVGASLTAIAADATLRTTSLEAKVGAKGLPAQATGILTQHVHGGTLNAGSFAKLGEGLTQVGNWVTQEMSTHDYTPSPVISVIEASADQRGLNEAACVAFALRCVMSGMSFTQAVTYLDQKLARTHAEWGALYRMVDVVSVKSVYNGLGIGGDKEPARLERERAAALLSPEDGDIIDPSTWPSPASNHDDLAWPMLVGPHIQADGTILSLAGLAPPAVVRAARSPELSIHGELDAEEQQTTVDAALTMGFDRIASVGAETSAQFRLSNHLRHWYGPGAEGAIVRKERYSAGFRVCIRYWGKELNGSLSVPAIAAQTHLGMIQSTYEVQIVGVDIRDLPNLGAFLGGTSGPFDLTTQQRLGALQADVNQALMNPAALSPCLTEVTLDLTSGHLSRPWQNALSNSFALRKIRHGHTLPEALEDLPAEADADVVRGVYQALVLGDQEPASAARRMARRILRLGNGW